MQELEDIIERGVALSNGDSIEMAHLPADLRGKSMRTFSNKEGRIPSLQEQEMAFISWVLGKVGKSRRSKPRYWELAGFRSGER